MVNVVKTGGMPVDIMMVSKSFEIEFFELIDVSVFDFVMSVFFYPINESPASVLSIVHVLGCFGFRCP